MSMNTSVYINIVLNECQAIKYPVMTASDVDKVRQVSKERK